MKNEIANLDTSYPAVAASVGYVRTAVTAIAALAGADEEVLDSVRLAVSEAVSNAVVHAYEEDAPGAVHIAAAAIGDELTVVVSDDGCGLGDAAESPGLGFGMALMALMCNSLTFTARPAGGTQVEMRLSLASRPAGEQPGVLGRASKADAAARSPRSNDSSDNAAGWEMSTLRRH